MLIKKNIYKVLLITLFAFVSSVEAANRYWVAVNDGTDKLWHDNANWSSSSGGSPGFNPPTKNQEAIFNGNSTVDVKLGSAVTVKKLRIYNGYSGTIDLNGKYLGSKKGPALYDGTVLVSAGSFFQSWGSGMYLYNGSTLTATGDGKIKLGHNLHIMSGATLNAPSGDNTRFIIKGGFNLHSGGTFNHNNGTVTMATKWKGTTGAAIRVDDGPGTGRNFYNLYKSGPRNVT